MGVQAHFPACGELKHISVLVIKNSKHLNCFFLAKHAKYAKIALLYIVVQLAQYDTLLF